jgi:hypothetical protein
MTENTSTTYSNQLAILAELWLNYRDDEEFADFIEYNDIGLPLAYVLANDIVKSTDLAEKFIGETFALLLAGLDVEDTGFEALDDILDTAA